MTSLADEWVAAQRPFWTQDLEDFLRANGAMFEEMEAYARDPDEPDIETFVNRPNWCPNPSFEYDQPGGAPLAWTLVLPGGTAITTFKVQNTWAAAGSKSCRITLATVPAGATADLVHPPVPAKPGQLWSASMVVNSLGGNLSAGVGVIFYNVAGAPIETDVALAFASSGVDGGTATATGIGFDGGTALGAGSDLDGGTAFSTFGSGPARYGRTCVVAPPGTASVSTICTMQNVGAAATTLDLYVDAAILQDGGPCDTYFDGDFAGNKWLGTPGNGPSGPVPPLPQPGWSKMLDIDRADTQGLPYLAQWVGERLPKGLPDAESRAWIRRSPNQDRGKLSAIAYGIMGYLTGTQSVFTREQSFLNGTADPDTLAIITFASETPNPAKVLQHLEHRLVPADLAVDYEAITSRTWAAIEAGSPSWATIESGSPSWRTIESAGPGFVPIGFVLWQPPTNP